MLLITSQEEKINFNPRPREGSDRGVAIQVGNALNFNPRPREGSDRRKLTNVLRVYHFNPRPREGSDMSFLRFGLPAQLFQSTPP